MQTITIRGTEFANIMEVHEWIASELAFPFYYGKNYSALYDCLTDITEDTEITLDLRDMEDDDLLQKLQKMGEVIGDAAKYNGCIHLAYL